MYLSVTLTNYLFYLKWPYTMSSLCLGTVQSGSEQFWRQTFPEQNSVESWSNCSGTDPHWYCSVNRRRPRTVLGHAQICLTSTSRTNQGNKVVFSKVASSQLRTLLYMCSKICLGMVTSIKQCFPELLSQLFLV